MTKSSVAVRAAGRTTSIAGTLSHSEFSLTVAIALACATVLGWFVVATVPDAAAPAVAQSAHVARVSAPPQAEMPHSPGAMPEAAPTVADRAGAVRDGETALRLDELSGVSLAARFEHFMARARTGDAALALALAQRLELCGYAGAALAHGVQEESLQRWSHVTIGGLAELHRESCAGLTDAQRSAADPLVKMAAQAGSPDARVEAARRALDGLGRSSPEAAGVLDADRTKALAAVTAELQDLTASDRNPHAAAMLAELHARGRGVPRDMRKALVYEIAALRLTGSHGNGTLQDHPSLSAWPSEERKAILEESSRVLEGGMRTPIPSQAR